MAIASDLAKTMKCCRCRRSYILDDMTPLVDEYNRWDGITYRNWCLPCWARRNGAKPVGDPEFYIPRNIRTRRFDRYAMRGFGVQSPAQIREATPVTMAEQAFTEIPTPDVRLDRRTLTAQEILDRQHNPSKHEELRVDSPTTHKCEFDGKQRNLPCDYCGLRIEDVKV